MRWYQETKVATLEMFLREIEKLKKRGYCIIREDADKNIVFDGKNTVECKASLSVVLEKGTSTFTITYMI